MPKPSPFTVSRRRFLAAGAVAALTLAVAGGAWRWRVDAAAAAPFLLTDDARAILAAIIPAMLDGAIGQGGQRAADIDSTIGGVRQALAGLPLSAQQEVQGLFTLLSLGPVRRLLAGVPADWAVADPAAVAAFLQRWRLHRLADLRVAYAALHDLVLGAWYAEPGHWAAMGYPGPLAALAGPAP